MGVQDKISMECKVGMGSNLMVNSRCKCRMVKVMEEWEVMVHNNLIMGKVVMDKWDHQWVVWAVWVVWVAWVAVWDAEWAMTNHSKYQISDKLDIRDLEILMDGSDIQLLCPLVPYLLFLNITYRAR